MYRILILLLCVNVLSGCFRHCYRSRPYSLSQTDLVQNVQQAFESSVVAPGDLRGGPWWYFFNDPQLNKFIELSLVSHPDIKVAEARIHLACQEAKIARSALLPHIFGIVDLKRQKISDLGEGFVPGLPDLVTQTTIELASALYEVDIWQRNRSLYYAALDQMRAEVAGWEEAKLLLSTTIAAVYFDLQMNLARKEVTEERIKARKELYDLHKQQFDLGIVSEFRLYEVDTDVQLLRDLLFQIEGLIDIDKHALAALVGNVTSLCGEEGWLHVAPAAQFHTPFPLPATLPIDLLNRRPDITAQKWLVEAACFDIKAARASFFPRIDLLGWIGFQSIQIDQLLRGAQLIALGDLSATLPIFVAGKLKAQLGVAQESLEIAIAHYNQIVLYAVEEVSDALSELMTADERQQSIERAIIDADHLLDLTEQKYENAIYSKLVVLNAFENLYLQKDLKVQIQLSRYEAAVALIRAIGGGYYACCP